jgi:hypothetical protein
MFQGKVTFYLHGEPFYDADVAVDQRNNGKLYIVLEGFPDIPLDDYIAALEYDTHDMVGNPIQFKRMDYLNFLYGAKKHFEGKEGTACSEDKKPTNVISFPSQEERSKRV